MHLKQKTKSSFDPLFYDFCVKKKTQKYERKMLWATVLNEQKSESASVFVWDENSLEYALLGRLATFKNDLL